MEIKTKYNIGDSVYFICNDVINYDQIAAIKIEVCKKGCTEISYTMTNVKENGFYIGYSHIVTKKEDTCKTSPQDLWKTN